MVLAGGSLRTVMIPDPSIPTNRPMHVETYRLPHLVAHDALFWAFSGTAHYPHIFGEPPMCNTTMFCYTNIENMFCSFTKYDSAVMFMSKYRYKKHEWIINNYVNRVLWDSDGCTDVDAIKVAIECGVSFSVAFLDSEGVWNVHPVDLPMFELNEKRFILKTVDDEYPLFFRYPETTIEMFRTHRDFFSSKPNDNTDGCAELRNIPKFTTFYSIFNDGTYYNKLDAARGTTQEYRRLIVFCERMSCEN
jgi:hypothetical protein